MNNKSKRELVYLYNSPLEVGLRCIVILAEAYTEEFDLQRLIYYDYLLLHSNDIDKNMKSLHPNSPYRSGEILIKRELMAKGLLLMCKKKLANVNFSERGICYRATEFTMPFLQYLENEYCKALRDTAKWVINNFKTYSDSELKALMNSHLDIWGEEFSKEPLMRSESI